MQVEVRAAVLLRERRSKVVTEAPDRLIEPVLDGLMISLYVPLELGPDHIES